MSAFPELEGVLGSGGPMDWDEVDISFQEWMGQMAGELETALAEAGFYEAGADPYPLPTVPINAPLPTSRPVIDAVRNVWLAKFNPGLDEWYDPQTNEYTSDPINERLFPWSHPESAIADGNFWLSTEVTPNNRIGIESVREGDLIIVQRMDPGKDKPHLRRGGADDLLVGVAIAWCVRSWTDASTRRRETVVGLLPAGRFRYEIPRNTARGKERLRGHSFAKMPQRPDGTGPPGFTVSAVVGEDVRELLAVCGIHPEALAETNIIRLMARLRATAWGNKELWQYRWDHVFKHSIRTKHERAAVERCHQWAADHGYAYQGSAELRPNAGFDLLFADIAGVALQVEVKGYVAKDLAAVHLQPSQAARARDAAAGTPPEWKLFAVLNVEQQPDEQVRSATETVALLDAGGLQVKGMAAQRMGP